MTATFTLPPEPVEQQEPEVSAWVGIIPIQHAFGIRYEEIKNDAGSWSMQLPVTAETAGERAALDYEVLVTFKEFGEQSFVGIVDEVVQRTVADGEEANQFVTYSGHSVLGELNDALVYGPIPIAEWSSGHGLDGLFLSQKPDVETRYFNYASVGLDRSSWTDAVVGVYVGQVPPLAPPNGYRGQPSPWPYPFTKWLMPRAISGGKHPLGDWYIAFEVETEGSFTYDAFFAVGENDSAWIWWDGALICEIDEKDSTAGRWVNIIANDGPHLVVAKIQHGGADASGNITGFATTIHNHYSDGGGLTQAPLQFSFEDNGFIVADYPAVPPCFRLDEILEELFLEPYVRGGLPGWTVDVDTTAHEDSAGEPFPLVREWSCRVGETVLNAMKSLAEDYVEFAADMTAVNPRTLKVWNMKDIALTGGGTATGGGSATAVEFTAGDAASGLTELTHHVTRPKGNALLTRWKGGYMEVDVSGLARRVEAFLSIEDTSDGPQGFWHSAAMVNAIGGPRVSMENFAHRMLAATQYRCLDTITAPAADLSPATWRCVSRAVATDRDGNGFVTSGFGDPRDDELARVERWQRRIRGSLDGASESAVPTSAFVRNSSTLSPVSLRFSTGGGGITLVGDRGTPIRPDQPLLIVRCEMEADVAGASGPTSVRLELNGSTLYTTTLPVLENTVMQTVNPVLVNTLDSLNVQTTVAGGHEGVTYQVIAMAATFDE